MVASYAELLRSSVVHAGYRVVDGTKAAVHWRAKVHSRITGTSVLTELIDVVEVKDGRIASYTELFAPR